MRAHAVNQRYAPRLSIDFWEVLTVDKLRMDLRAKS